MSFTAGPQSDFEDEEAVSGSLAAAVGLGPILRQQGLLVSVTVRFNREDSHESLHAFHVGLFQVVDSMRMLQLKASRRVTVMDMEVGWQRARTQTFQVSPPLPVVGDGSEVLGLMNEAGELHVSYMSTPTQGGSEPHLLWYSDEVDALINGRRCICAAKEGVLCLRGHLATAAGDPAETASFASNVSCVAPVASSQSQQCTTPRTATTAPANNASVNLPVQSSFMPQILQAANGYMAFHNHRATPDAATPALSGAPRSGASRGGDVVPSASQTNTGTPLVGTSAPAMATGGPGLSATIAAMVGARQGRAAGRVLPAVPINPQVTAVTTPPRELGVLPAPTVGVVQPALADAIPAFAIDGAARAAETHGSFPGTSTGGDAEMLTSAGGADAEPLRWNTIRSCHISFDNEDRMVARRARTEFMQAIVFSDEPLRRHGSTKAFAIAIEGYGNTWSGTLKIGVTSVSPEQQQNLGLLDHNANQLEESWIMSSRSVFHNGEEIVPNYGTDPEGLEGLRTGDTVRVEVHDNGELTFFLRGSCMGTAAHNLPVQDDLWAVVEIYGQTESIRRLPVETQAPEPPAAPMIPVRRPLNMALPATPDYNPLCGTFGTWTTVDETTQLSFHGGFSAVVSRESVSKGPDSPRAERMGTLAWRFGVSGNDSFCVGVIPLDQFDSAFHYLYEDTRNPHVVNSAGTFGGNVRRVFMDTDQEDLVVELDHRNVLYIYRVPKSPDGPTGRGRNSQAASAVTVAALPLPDVACPLHLVVGGWGTTVAFKPLGEITASQMPRESLASAATAPAAAPDGSEEGELGDAKLDESWKDVKWHGSAVQSTVANRAFDTSKGGTDVRIRQTPAATDGYFSMCVGTPMASGRHATSFRIIRDGRKPGATLGGEYYVGFVNADFDDWEQSIKTSCEMAIEDNNNGHWQFDLDNPISTDSKAPAKLHKQYELSASARAFCSHDLIYLLADFDKKYVKIICVRPGAVYALTHSLPEGAELCFAATLYNTDARLLYAQEGLDPRWLTDAVVLPAFRWSKAGTGLSIQQNGLAVRHKDRREGVLGSTPMRVGKFHWSVRLQNGDRDAAIGVAWPTVDLSDSRYQQKGTYVWELTKELVEMHASQSRGNCLRKPSNGQVIHCHLDMDAGTLGFSVDAGPIKVAFSGLRGETLHAYGKLGSSNHWSDLTLVQSPDFSKMKIIEVKNASHIVRSETDSDAGSVVNVNGMYTPVALNRYVGVDAFANRGAPNLVILRWRGNVWYLADMGRQRTHYPGHGAWILFQCDSTSTTPPTSGWVAAEHHRYSADKGMFPSVPVFSLWQWAPADLTPTAADAAVATSHRASTTDRVLSVDEPQDHDSGTDCSADELAELWTRPVIDATYVLAPSVAAASPGPPLAGTDEAHSNTATSLQADTSNALATNAAPETDAPLGQLTQGPAALHLNQHLGLSSLVDAAKIEARIQSELGKTVQKVLTQKGSKGAADLSAQDRAQLLHSHSRRHRIGQCTRVSLRVPARFAHDPSRFTLWRYAMVNAETFRCKIAAEADASAKQDTSSVSTRSDDVVHFFDVPLSSSDLTFSSDATHVRRPGTSGCYPAALVHIVGGRCVLAMRLDERTCSGNSFSFGLAKDMRNTYGDGFGNEGTSCGLFQNCANDSQSLRFINNSDNASPASDESDAESHRVDEGDVVSLVYQDGDVVFRINCDIVYRAHVGDDMKVAGATLHTDGALQIVDPEAEGIFTTTPEAGPASMAHAGQSGRAAIGARLARPPSLLVDTPAVAPPVRARVLTEAELAAMPFDEQMEYALQQSLQDAAPPPPSVEPALTATDEQSTVLPGDGAGAAADDAADADEDAPEMPDVDVWQLRVDNNNTPMTKLLSEHSRRVHLLSVGDVVVVLKRSIVGSTVRTLVLDPRTARRGWVTEVHGTAVLLFPHSQAWLKTPPTFVPCEFSVTESCPVRMPRSPAESGNTENAMVELQAIVNDVLRPGAVHCFAVGYLGTEYEEIFIDSAVYHAAYGADVDVVPVKETARAPTAAATDLVVRASGDNCRDVIPCVSTSSAVKVSWSAEIGEADAVMVAFRTLGEHSEGLTAREQDFYHKHPPVPQPVGVVVPAGQRELLVDGLAPWTPYVFVVTTQQHSGATEVPQVHESKVFVWIPADELPRPCVTTGHTNELVVVSADAIDCETNPYATVLNGATYKAHCTAVSPDGTAGTADAVATMTLRPWATAGPSDAPKNTWNEDDKNPNIILQDNNTQVTYSRSFGQNAIVRAVEGYDRGTHYWETTIVLYDGGGSGYNFIGLASRDVSTESTLPPTNAGPGIWAVQLGDKMNVFNNGAGRTKWKSCRYSKGITIGLSLDMDAGSLTVYVNRLLVGTPFTNLPRGEKLYPVLGVGCLAPNIYSTDFDAVAPAPQGPSACNPTAGIMCRGAKMFYLPVGLHPAAFVGRAGAIVEYVADATTPGSAECTVRFPDEGLVTAPMKDFTLPSYDRLMVRRSANSTMQKLINIVSMMTSEDAAVVAKHLMQRCFKENTSIPAMSYNDQYWRRQVRQVVHMLESARDRAAYHSLVTVLQRNGNDWENKDAVQALEGKLRVLPQPYYAEFPVVPGKQYTFRLQLELDLNCILPSPYRVPCKPQYFARGGTVGGSTQMGDVVQLSLHGNKTGCLNPGEFGEVVEENNGLFIVRSSSSEHHSYRQSDIVTANGIPTLGMYPCVGDQVQLVRDSETPDDPRGDDATGVSAAEAGGLRQGGALRHPDAVGHVLRESGEHYDVVCNGRVSRYARAAVEAVVAAAPLPTFATIVRASSRHDTLAHLLDGKIDTYWESQGTKPHWIEIGLPEHFDEMKIQLVPWGGSWEPHAVVVKASRRGKPRHHARVVVPKMKLPTTKRELFTLLTKATHLQPHENTVFFEVYSCGASDSGSNCKISGFVFTGTNEHPASEVSIDTHGHWLQSTIRSHPVCFTVPYNPPLPPEKLNLVRENNGNAVLSWAPPSYNGGMPVHRYRVRCVWTPNILYASDPIKSKVTTMETSEHNTVLPKQVPMFNLTCHVTAINASGESEPCHKPAQLRHSDIIIFGGSRADGGAIDTRGEHDMFQLLRATPPRVWRTRSSPMVQCPGGVHNDDTANAMTPANLIDMASLSDSVLDPVIQDVSIVHILAAMRNAEALQQLLQAPREYDADIVRCMCQTDIRGRTPLLVAASSLHLETVRVLVDALEARAPPGDGTALGFPAPPPAGEHSGSDGAGGKVDRIGALLCAADADGNTVVHYIASMAFVDATAPKETLALALMERLCPHIASTAVNRVGETVLLRALKYGNAMLARWLLQRGLCTGGEVHPDGRGNTALHISTLLLLRTAGLLRFSQQYRFHFDPENKSDNITLDASMRSVAENVEGSHSIRMMPAITSGRHSVSFVIARTNRGVGGSLGCLYFVGFVGPDFTSWDSRILDPPRGYGMEDDNSSSGGRWSFPVTESGNSAFRSGDKVTLVVDFDEDSLSITRTSADDSTPSPATFTHHGIPFGEVYFALTVYNADATVQIVDSEDTSTPVVPLTEIASNPAVDEPTRPQVDALCDMISMLQQLPGARVCANAGGLTPAAMVLHCTSRCAPPNPPPTVALARQRLGALYFGDAQTVLGMLGGGGNGLVTVYNALASWYFEPVLNALKQPPQSLDLVHTFVRSAALIFTHCYASSLRLGDASQMDRPSEMLLQNLRTVFAAFPTFAMLELGECARALASPLRHNTVIPLDMPLLTGAPAAEPLPSLREGPVVLAPGCMGGEHEEAGPLAECIRAGDAEGLQAALATVTDAGNALRVGGKSLLHVAVEESQAACVRVLLRHGANVNATTTHGATPLMQAVVLDNEEIVTMLLQTQHIQPDFTADSDADTALMLACAKGHGNVAIVRRLLEGGASSTRADSAGDEPSVVARRHGHTPCADVLASWAVNVVVDAERGSNAGNRGGMALRVFAATPPGKEGHCDDSAGAPAHHPSEGLHGEAAASGGDALPVMREEGEDVDFERRQVEEDEAFARRLQEEERMRARGDDDDDGSTDENDDDDEREEPSHMPANARPRQSRRGARATMAPEASFGTWARRLPRERADQRITMQERLALAVGRLVKEQVALLDTCHAACSKRTDADRRDAVVDASYPTDGEGVHPTVDFGAVRDVFTTVTSDIWGYVATEMDYLEAQLRAGRRYLKEHKGKRIAPHSASKLASMYMSSLLDVHQGGGLMTPPCVDVSSYGHVALLADALLLGLQWLQKRGASENTVSALQLPPTEVFFRRTESVAVPGFDSMEALFGQDVDTAFPLATNPVLLTGPRSDMFGSSSEVAEADEGGSLRQQSGRLSTSSFHPSVSGLPATPPHVSGSRYHTGWEAVFDIAPDQSLEGTFQRRWQHALELMSSEISLLYPRGERAGFFASRLMSMLSIATKKKIFKERLRAHPKRGSHSARFTVVRKDIVQSSASALGAEFDNAKFPMAIDGVSFKNERGVGEGVLRGWWTAVARALAAPGSVFSALLADSTVVVDIVLPPTVDTGNSANDKSMVPENTAPLVRLHNIPLIPGRNPLEVKWIGKPSAAATGLTFTAVDSDVGGVVVLSNGSTFANPTHPSGTARCWQLHPLAIEPHFAGSPRRADRSTGSVDVGGGGGSRDTPTHSSKTTPKLVWEECGAGLTIGDDGTALSHGSQRGGAIGSLGFKTGVHVFEVLLKSGDCEAALGVATADCNLSSRDYALVNSWVWEFDERLLFGDGKRVDAPRTKARHYGKPPDRRSRVRCVVNMDEGTVGYQVITTNQGSRSDTTVDLGVAFHGLKGRVVFPFGKLGSSNRWTNLTYVSHTTAPVPRNRVIAPTFAQLFYEPGNRGYYAPCYTPQWTDSLNAVYRFVGRFIGLALFNGTRVEFRLCRHVIKYMLRKPLKWHDLAFFSAEKYEIFRKMVSESELWIADDVMFEIDLENSAGTRCVPLKDGGAALKVTRDNVLEYVELSAMALMQTSALPALDSMRQGLEDVFPHPSILDILTPEDFAVILNGVPVVETSVLMAHTQCSGASREWYNMFWRVVDGLSAIEKGQLLAFWTGSSCVPSDLSDWSLRLEVHQPSSKLPEAATCPRQLRIPKYKSAKEIKSKLSRAIIELTFQQA